MVGVIIQAILTGVGLAMDAFSVSVSDGILIGRVKLSQAVKIALFFGFFQFMMPVLGYLAGSTFASDSASGISMDWDGKTANRGASNTKNELDGMLTVEQVCLLVTQIKVKKLMVKQLLYVLN